MPFIPAFAIAFFITLITTPLTIVVAKKFNLVDDPKKRPHPAHIQNRVIPRAGGLPIYLGIITAIALTVPMDKHIMGLIIGMFLLLTVGLADDYLNDFSPYPRLLFQFLAAAIIVGAGVGITFVTNPLGGVIRLDEIVYQIYFFGVHNLILIADIFAFFWIVWMMNMINWAKGVDGQMPGIITISAFIIGLLSLKLYNAGDPNQLSIATLSFITAGSSLAFLIFNWHPARILPGQSASTILGLMIATLSIMSGAKLATALIVLLIPAVDFFYTFFRRIFSGKSPFFGDQKHLHHLLLRRGYSHQQISLFYLISCAILGLAATYLSSQGKFFVVVGVGIIILGTILWLHLLHETSKEPE
jgi:UDP-GlcNAc:undecaprenyl-phosphate GlcNAc-1-phosphate transferase